MSDNKSLSFGTLYELNQKMYAEAQDMTPEKFSAETVNMALWFSSRPERKHFMLLCRELYDYTVFEFNEAKYDHAREELQAILLSRGKPVMVDYNHENDAYEIWMRVNGEIHMYMLFWADSYVVEA